MIKGTIALLLSGGLLAGLAVPKEARADAAGEVVAFIAGAAVGYALNDRRVETRVHHHYHDRYAYHQVAPVRSVVTEYRVVHRPVVVHRHHVVSKHVSHHRHDKRYNKKHHGKKYQGKPSHRHAHYGAPVRHVRYH